MFPKKEIYLKNPHITNFSHEHQIMNMLVAYAIAFASRPTEIAIYYEMGYLADRCGKTVLLRKNAPVSKDTLFIETNYDGFLFHLTVRDSKTESPKRVANAECYLTSYNFIVYDVLETLLFVHSPRRT